MHTFTLSLFSSSLTPTGSNKGCSITRGNSYLYNKEHLTIFSFSSSSYLRFSLLPLNNVACKLKSFPQNMKKFPLEILPPHNWNSQTLYLELFNGNWSHHHHLSISISILPILPSFYLYLHYKLLEVFIISH